MMRIVFSRRSQLKYLIAVYFALFGFSLQTFAQVSPHPRPETFQSGDLLWPALPGTFIPFGKTRGLVQNPEIAQWEEQKQLFIENARKSDDPELKAVADNMEHLTYEEFQSRYFDSDAPRTRGLRPFAAALPQVGHVAIIEIDRRGVPWVIEAMPKAQTRYAAIYSRFPNGVIRTRYDKWIQEHENYNIWHGRVKDQSKAQRNKIALQAKKFLGKDYWFWSFDLSNVNAFYCSKLVWVSVWRALKLPIDGDSTFVRKFWVTPKELINSKRVELLHSPGDYGGR